MLFILVFPDPAIRTVSNGIASKAYSGTLFLEPENFSSRHARKMAPSGTTGQVHKKVLKRNKAILLSTAVTGEA